MAEASRTERACAQHSSSNSTHAATAPIAPDITALRALADETRLAIVGALSREGELCACKLLEHLDVRQSTLSHHMKVLVEAGLVSQRKAGRWAHYRLDADAFERLGRDIVSLGVHE